MVNVIIRKLDPEDVKAVVRLMRDTIRIVNRKDYTQKQIEVWSSKNTARRLSKKVQEVSALRIVAVFDGKIVGTACLKFQGNELTGLYVKHDMHGKGIGSRLLRHIESYARRKGLKDIKLYSTLTAVDFYKHQGYKRIRSMSHLFDTVYVPCVLMKKFL